MPVFHLDIESFPVAVERVKDRSLAERPLVIAPDKPRAVVLSASPEAKALGVFKDMPAELARRRFPEIRVIPPNHRLYRKASRYALGVACGYSPIVEPLGYGHIALDMSGMDKLYGSLESAALKLCREIRDRAFLPSTVGIAANKLVSAIAAKEVQERQEPLCRVDRGSEPAFLAPLPSRVLPEWRERSVRKLLFELNLATVRHIQEMPRELMGFAMGKAGLDLHRHALGVDPRPVTPKQKSRNLSEERRFNPDTNNDDELRAAVYGMVEKLCARLRAMDLGADKARLSLMYTDDVWRQRLYTFVHTQQEDVVYRAIIANFEKLCDRRQRVRLLKLNLTGLHAHHCQATIFEASKPQKVTSHLDAIRERFGDAAIGYGRGLAAEKPAA